MFNPAPGGGGTDQVSLPGIGVKQLGGGVELPEGIQAGSDRPAPSSGLDLESLPGVGVGLEEGEGERSVTVQVPIFQF